MMIRTFSASASVPGCSNSCRDGPVLQFHRAPVSIVKLGKIVKLVFKLLRILMKFERWIIRIGIKPVYASYSALALIASMSAVFFACFVLGSVTSRYALVCTPTI